VTNLSSQADRLAAVRRRGSNSLYRRALARLAPLRLSKLARAVKEQRLTYLSGPKMVRLEQALRQAARGDGAYLEFGVALGGSAIVIANAAAAARQRFFGFDVFGLIPPPTSDKDDAKSKQRYEVIASGQATGIGGDPYYGYRDDLYDAVVKAFQYNGLAVDGRTISLVRGLFEETWPGANVGRVAFCHIDCDWYDPVKFCLEQVAPRLAADGLILLDDYHDYGGCAQATRDFLNANPGFALWDGPNVIVQRNSHSPPPRKAAGGPD
jgi:asparagine synthase (glutamine-hydrolysing)